MGNISTSQVARARNGFDRLGWPIPDEIFPSAEHAIGLLEEKAGPAGRVVFSFEVAPVELFGRRIAHVQWSVHAHVDGGLDYV